MIFPGRAGRLKFIYRRDAFGAGTRNADERFLQNSCRPWLPQTHARRCGCARYWAWLDMRSAFKSKSWRLCLNFCVFPYDTDFMLCQLRLLVIVLVRILYARRNLLLENLALRQQLLVMKQRYPRPQISTSDKLFWVILRRLWPEWRHGLILVQPETVVRWH